MNENGRRDGNTVLLTIIGVATLLVALVGATFAYFTATINNNNAQSVSVTTATPISLVYAGHTLQLTDATPGMSTTDKQFTKATGEFNAATEYYTRNSSTVAASGGVGEYTLVPAGDRTAANMANYYVASANTNHQFTVTNPSEGTGTHVRQTYDMTFVVDTNTFTTVWKDDTTKNHANQLVATVSASTDNSGATSGTANTPVLANVSNSSVVNVSGNVATIDLTDGCTASWSGETRSCSGTTNTAKPTTEYQLVQDQLINVGEVHTYEIVVKFNELATQANDPNATQDENQGASFGAHIKVDDPKSVGD